MITDFEWPQLKTLQSKEILSYLMDANQEPMIRTIIAPTGHGKTNAIRLIKKQQPHNTHVVTLGESYSRNDMLDEISELIGARAFIGKNSKHRRIKAISEKLNETATVNQSIVLDEFENANIPVFKSIKELYDGVIENSSIVLIGTEQLITQLNKTSISQSIPQLRRRLKAGIRYITPIKKSRDFTPFFEKLIPSEKEIQDLLLTLCDNYGELHDYLYPVLNICHKKGIKITVDLFKNYHKIN